jgi:hypothetical protein
MHVACDWHVPCHCQIARPGRVAANADASQNIEGAMLMSLGTILLIILILALVGALPTWPYSSGWGYYPTGGFGLLILILIILIVLGRI